MKLIALIAMVASATAVNLKFPAYSKDNQPPTDAYGATASHYVLQRSSDVPNQQKKMLEDKGLKHMQDHSKAALKDAKEAENATSFKPWPNTIGTTPLKIIEPFGTGDIVHAKK